MTFSVKKDGPAIAQLAKCGSSTIAGAIGGYTGITNDEARDLDVRVAFIRNPLDRLGSAYSFFSGKRMRGNYPEGSPPSYTETYSMFIDWALESDNAHVVPQYELLLTETDEFVPNRLHKLSDIENVWADYYPMPKGEFLHRNASERLASTDYRANDISLRYAKDIELWHRLQ